MILGSTMSEKIFSNSNELSSGLIIFPLIVHCLDLTVSCIGATFVSTKKGLPSDGQYGELEDPLFIMKKGYYVSFILGSIGIFGITYYFLNFDANRKTWLYFAGCGMIGLMDSFLFVIITQIYTDYMYPYVKGISASSQTGHATNIIAGLAVGLESTFLPTILISISLISTYSLGHKSLIVPNDPHLSGLYGTAVGTMGMFVSGVFILAMSGFGPIADNAGGIIEMSLHDAAVRQITDRLDAVGNVTKANTKGYSVGSAALACFLLFSAYMDEIMLLKRKDKLEFKIIDIANPEIYISGIIGSSVVFLFSSMALNAVGIAAQSVIKEVKTQISKDENILTGKSKPNYKQCVSIVTKAGLQEMIKPGLLSVLSPIVIGITFRIYGSYVGNNMLGAQAVGSFLMFATSTGILMALFFNNAGGAWDNAKKFIEAGNYGGKGSETHKAAVTGDTVGDPCKDTAGPSIHILIKLVSTISLVFAPLFISFK